MSIPVISQVLLKYINDQSKHSDLFIRKSGLYMLTVLIKKICIIFKIYGEITAEFSLFNIWFFSSITLSKEFVSKTTFD